ncbi:MAG: KamA family radical SAM protein [Spirochaetaceae bacterium]|nr:MAG: KamA family radical SAM protein [Spirochaetaceae bacterium]
MINNAFNEDLLHAVHEPTQLRFGVSRYYAGLATCADPTADPIAAQYVPQAAERDVRSYEDPDPIGDMRYTVAPRLIHHYHDRALLLVNDNCAVYCRHCFRRHFTGQRAGSITAAELEQVCSRLARMPQVREILLSGGDPLMLADTELFALIDRLREVGDYLIRVCTRIPVVLPQRVTDPLCTGLGRRLPAWVVLHVNHPRELTEAFAAAVRRLLGAGMAVASQTVLLRGINNRTSTLEALFSRLARLGVRPYYLFQADLATGTAHFRTPIEQGLNLMHTLRARLSELALPVYAVDLPDGGGKVPVESALLRTEEDSYVLRGPDGREYRYPRETLSEV